MAEPWQTYLETNNRPLFCLDERMNCVYANRQAVSALNVSGVNDPEWQKIEQAIREHGWEHALLEGPSGSGPLRLQAWPQVENWPLVLEILSDAKIPIERETQWLKYALEASGMGVWSWNQQDNKVLWSEQVEAIFGLKPRTFPGTFDAYCQLVHPADLEMVLQRVQESMAQGKQYTIEHRAVRPDGSIRWIWAVGKVRFDAQGKANGMLGAVLDISPRKHLEAMLALISRSNVESHPQGFFEGLLDLVKQALDCESAIVALSEPSDPPRLKLECGLGIHEKWAGALLPLDAEPWSEVLTQTHLVVAQGAESCGDLLLKEQQAQAFAGVTLIDGDGQILGILAAFSRNPFAQIQTVRILLEVIASRAARDIERAHYLKTLQNQSLLLEITQKTAQIGGWQWDLERERFFWTSETFQIHRIPAGQAPNFEELLRVYTVSSRQLLRYHWQEALETGRAFEIDLELDFKEGSHWVRWRGVPTLKQGEILAFH
ncbi:MAG: PAS domain-containing protein, partial [Acidobacteria bacterium]|nr:PAS domain-containing protein [Acidobacteriota bacterium]